jgi:hypothetical protein
MIFPLVPFSRPHSNQNLCSITSRLIQQMRAALSFTGGKDSVLAMQEAIQQVLVSG